MLTDPTVPFARFASPVRVPDQLRAAITAAARVSEPVCVPILVEAAINYVSGTSWSKAKLTQDVCAATLRGEPFSTWAAGIDRDGL